MLGLVKLKADQKGFAHLFLLILLVAGIGIGIYLVQNPAIFKPRADQNNKCLASDPESFKQCLHSAQTNETINEIEITKQIVCSSVTECTNTGSGGGFILTQRGRPLTIFGTPGTGAGFKRTQNYNYALLTLGGTSVRSVTLKDLIFDENRDSECDFVTQGPATCNSTLVMGPKIADSTVDNVTILHSKSHGMQITNAYNLTVKNSIFYNSEGDGIWMDSAYASTCPRTIDFMDYTPCAVDENKVNRFIIIENNLMAENDISGLEFYAYGTQEYPSKIKGNLLVHNHKNAKYINCPNEVKDAAGNVTRQGGHCPGGQMAITRTKNLVVEENIIRDGYINTVKPVDNYLPEPGASGKIYENLTPSLHASGIELADTLQDTLIQNNKLYNNSGVGLFADYVGVTRDYKVSNVSIIWNMAYDNKLGAFAGNPGPGLDIALTRDFGRNGTTMGGMSFANNFLDATHSNQLPYKKAFVFADPPICNPQAGAQCNTKIVWYSQDQTNVKIGLKDDPGTNFASAPNGSFDAPWLTEGVFEIRSGTQVLASTFATRLNPTTPRTPTTRILTASPNTCTITSGETCTSVISWNSNYSDLKITIKEAPGSLFASGASGSQTADWIRDTGATFEAYSNGNLVDSLFVKGVTSSNPSANPSPTGNIFTASPNPCTITSGETCTSVISWNSNYPDLKIGIKEAPGSLFASGASGSQTANWIRATGATFEAYSGTTLVGSLFVKGIESEPIGDGNGVLSASPNPCIITSGQSCTSTISWNSNYSDLKITIKENPGSLFASGASGSQNAPWITATGATFEAYTGGVLVDSLFVKAQP